MDPATLQMALQLGRVVARSRVARAAIAGALVAALVLAAVTVQSLWVIAGQTSSSSLPPQGCAGTTNETANVFDAGDVAAAGEPAVWAELRRAGFDAVHAAGVMGNMQDESGFDPHIIQGGGHSRRPADAGGGGYGLVQWTPGRKLADYIGSATPTVRNQIATLKAQLAGRGPHPEKAAGREFWATTGVEAAARVFHLRYERSASTDSSRRESNALAIYQRRQGIAAGPAAPTAAPAPPCPAAAATGEPATGQVADVKARTTMDGVSVSAVAAAQILLAERESGIDFRIMQGDLGGSHIAASGTSHNYSGVVDVAPGTTEAEKVLRRAGFAAWARNVAGRSSVGSGAHVHAVSLLDPGAKQSPQLTGSWARHENGLNGGRDPAPHYAWYPDLAKRLTKVHP